MKDMKFAYIMRGIPGSGKSTVAEQIVESYGYCGPGEPVIHSTDNLCMVDGEYRFDPELAAQRHAQNLNEFRASLDAGVPRVICDNTNIKVKQFAPYVEAAQAHGYQVVIVELVHPALDVAVERNSHGVPREVINQMILDWEPAQHCVTVDAVNEAAGIVVALQGRTRGLIAAGFATGFTAGAVVGALIVAVAWLVHP